MRTVSNARRLLPMLLSAVLLGPSLSAQFYPPDPIWVGFDGSPAGTPASVVLDASQSSTQRTVVFVQIHGFWKASVQGPDGQTYDKLDFPGLSRTTKAGTPSLPVVQPLLAIGTSAQAATFVARNIESQQFVSGIRPHPALVPGEDDEEIDPTGDPGPGDTQGSDPSWFLNNTIYSSGAIFPGSDGESALVKTSLGRVKAAAPVGHVAKWDSGANRLIVTTNVQFIFDHPGTLQASQWISKITEKLYAGAYINWSELGGLYPKEPWVYHSRYLIIAPSLWWDTLEPFVQFKKTQGYEVTVVASLTDPASIRGAIANWYGTGQVDKDHFCMIVGDTMLANLDVVSIQGETVPTDDTYGCIGANDQSKEVHVGRLSVDNDTDLGNQLTKLINYQKYPVPGARYDTALLVAHAQGYPGKYTGSHEIVANSSYSHPPTFLTSYGGTGGTNQQVVNAITAGMFGDGLGLVAYRGHGSTRTWSDWNLMSQDWHSNNVMTLANPVNPVVWSISCTNSNLDWGWGTTQDSISEVWMEVPNGAVAAYGATRTTSTDPNHLLNEALFRALYHNGITTHAHAIEAAEAEVWAQWPGHKNPWAYLLLGDPSMTVRRDPVAEFFMGSLPSSLSLDNAGNEIPISAYDSATGAPIQDGMLSFYKPSFLQGEDDEMLGAVWMTASGHATLNTNVATPGALHVGVRDQDGNVFYSEIQILMGSAWKDLGSALGGSSGTPALAGVGSLAPGTPYSVLITGAPPLGTAFVCLGLDTLNAPFKGGVLVPDINPPGLVTSAPTDSNGNLNASGNWPTNIPSGLAIFWQSWFVDAGGPVGFSATNAIRSITP